MSSIIPFLDQLAALQGLFDLVYNLPTEILSLIVSVIYLVTYPVILIFNYLVMDLNYLWSVMVTGINNIIGLQNVIYTTYYGVLNVDLPEPWKMLLFMAIAVNVYVRVYVWIKRIPVVGRII